MKALRAIALTCAVLFLGLGIVSAQSWTPLNNQLPADVGASGPLLLNNGTVLIHDGGASDWWILTPDNTGSYQNGTWTKAHNLPAGYAPLYYASAVLPNTQVVVMGGEYNEGQGAWTNKGAIYTQKTKKWANLDPPSGWSSVGDAQSVILANGTFMVANCCTTQEALLDAQNLTWTATGTGKNDINDEEGWTLLPSGEVLTVDTNTGTEYSEIYNPVTGSWSPAGSTVADVVDYGSHEIGPAVLRPDGTVLQTGATGQNAIYNSNTGVWSAAPNFPLVNGQQMDIADGPAALLVSGNVLCMTSPGVYQTGVQFYEWNGSTFTAVPNTPNSPDDSSYYGNMLELPTGQILLTDFSNDIELYTPAGGPEASWAPTITSVPTTLDKGKTYTVEGTQLNGLSQGAAYGDDNQSATNYPLVRITNTATGNVYYCLTDNPSSMGVATGSLVVTADFTVPSKIEKGAAELEVVTNGIASNPVSVTIK